MYEGLLWSISSLHDFCTDIKMFPIKFCTNGKYLQEHIEKINYKYFHHTNGK